MAPVGVDELKGIDKSTRAAICHWVMSKIIHYPGTCQARQPCISPGGAGLLININK